MKMQRNRSLFWVGIPAAVYVGCVLTPGVVPTTFGASTPSFRNNNAGSNAAFLSGEHKFDFNTTNGGDITAAMPTPAATIPSSAGLQAPFGSGGHGISGSGGSTFAKGGSGHTEGSNLGKITFASGSGVDQTDPGHVIGPSTYTVQFNYQWDIPAGTTFGATSGTFTVPVAAKVGSGSGAFAQFEYNVNWDKVINGVTSQARPDFVGSVNFPAGSGTTVTSVTATPVTIPSITSDSAGGLERIIMSGSIRFIANNDDSKTIIELLGKQLTTDSSDELVTSPGFSSQYNDPLHPEYRIDPATGFEEEILPEPSVALIGAAGLLTLAARRRRQSR